jgi:hypothetical protein
MKTDSPRLETLLRASLVMPQYVGEMQLPDTMRFIDDTITTLDGLYTQLALIALGDIREACAYEQAARQYLKDFYYTAIHAVSHKNISEDSSMPTFDHSPFKIQQGIPGKTFRISPAAIIVSGKNGLHKH